MIAPWRSGWASEIPHLSSVQRSLNKRMRASNSIFMGKSSFSFRSGSGTLPFLTAFSFFFRAYLFLVIHASLIHFTSLQSSLPLPVQIIYAFTICTCRICTPWSLFHLVLPYISVALALGLSVISSRVSPLSYPSVKPWTGLVLSNCIDIVVRLSRRCCHHPCFTNPFTPSTLPLPVSHLFHICFSSDLFVFFRFSVHVLFCFLSLFVSFIA